VADPKNTDPIAPIQEVVDALWRYIENSDANAPEKLQQRVTKTDRQKHLDDLEGILRTIAKGPNPERQAEAIRIRVVRRIDYHRSSHARDLHYEHFDEENSDLRLCYFIRLTSNRLKIGQRRGSRSRTAAVEEAAAIKKTSELEVIEKRALDLLKGVRRKPRKNSIETQAIQLAEATKDKWFSPRRTGRPKGYKGKWTRKPDAKLFEAYKAVADEDRSFEALKPLLTLTDLVSITAPIIEEFAGEKITRRNDAFMALLHIVRAYSEVITRETSQRAMLINEKTVQQASSRVRGELRNTSAGNLSYQENIDPRIDAFWKSTDTKIGPKS
jgi:hypothetical protein